LAKYQLKGLSIPVTLQDAGSEAQSNFTSRRINEVMAFPATASCLALTSHIHVGALQIGATTKWDCSMFPFGWVLKDFMPRYLI